MQIKEAILEYLHHLIVNQVKAKATVDRYQTVLNNYHNYLKEIMVTEINQIDITDIQAYLGLLKQQYQPKTVSQSISIIRSFHNYLSNHFSNLNNPALKIKTTKTPAKLPKFFSDNDLEHFFATFSDQEIDIFHRAIFELLYATGLRVSELVSLNFQELNTKNQMIKIVGKGNKERIIPIATYSLEILDTYLKLREKWNKKQLKYVFIKPNGTVITRQYVWSMMKKHLELANLDLKLSPHSFRHTFATDLLDNDADLRIVQELLGHSNVTTTQIYTHLSNKRITDLYEKFHPKSRSLNKRNNDKD